MSADGLAAQVRSEAEAIIQSVVAVPGVDGRVQSRESLRLRRTVVRQFSRQYWFDVDAGSASRGIVVKVCDRRTPRRPRAAHLPVTPPPDFDWSSRAAAEYDALVAIANHFDAIDDPRFGSVRALALIRELNAVVTERFEAVPLKAWFRRASRLHPLPAPRHLTVALSNAGAWLREYQKRPVSGGLLRATRDDFLTAAVDLCHSLMRTTGEERHLRWLLREVEKAAENVLPAELPMGAAHGDFGQSNVLITPDQRILVLDTLADWQVPTLEDVAYFLVGIECSRIQVLTGGIAFSAARVAALRRAFLDGYLGHDAEPAGLGPYETLLVLDRWVAQLGKLDGGTVGRAKRRMVNDWFRRHTATTLTRLG